MSQNNYKTSVTQRSSAKRYYDKRKKHGLCIHCPQLAEPGRVRCADCKEITKDYSAGMRDIRKMKNLCADCGKRPSRDGRVSCQECADRWVKNRKNLKKSQLI